MAGGTWATLFVQPALAARAPEVLEAGLPSVVVGYAVSYVVFSIGWIWTGVALLRARIVPTWLGVVLTVSGALAVVPGPGAFRLLLVSIAATLVGRTLPLTAPCPRADSRRLSSPGRLTPTHDHGAVTAFRPTKVVPAP